MHNGDADFILYYFQMFFAYEAVFLAFVQPKLTDILSKLIENIKRVEVTDLSGRGQAYKALEDGIYWYNHFPPLNMLWKKATIGSLILGIPLSLLIYGLHHVTIFPIPHESRMWIIVIGFLYMFIKLGYYFFQYKKTRRLIRDIELIFSFAVNDKVVAEEILKDCKIS
jgi:hypothetical protein